MGERIIYLVRHGQADRTTESTDKLGNGLTPLGRRQARWVARRLSGLPINVIHHSTLRRAAETAAIIGEQFPQTPLCPSRLLWESVPGLPITVRQFINYKGVSRGVIKRDQERAARAFAKYFKPVRGNDRHEIIVAHGNIIRHFLLPALGMKMTLWTHTDIRNCGLSEVRVLPDGRTMLLALNDTGHIPRQWLTYL